MNDIHFLNHKYNTIESLLTSKGDLNSAIVRRMFFKHLDVYKKIFEDSKDLDVFGDVKLNDRVNFITNKLSLNKCPICEKPYIRFEKSQRMYRLCRHHFNLDRERFSDTLSSAVSSKKSKLLLSLSDSNMFMKNCEFESQLDCYFNKPNNFNFQVTSKSFAFLHDLIIKTKDILPVLNTNLKCSERLYIAKNNITEIPKCIYCDELVNFRNRIHGYSSTCMKHKSLLGSEKKVSYNLKRLVELVDDEKYEIIKLPAKMSMDILKIKCRKCGRESEWTIKNGTLGKIHEKHLCRFCEVNHSVAEEEIKAFIESFYNGKIIFKNGSRKIIPPYELDIYIPESNIAVEFDGLYWHSELNGGKDPKYHLMKTELCEEKNIHLVHIFENEWKNHKDIVKSRIKNLFGVYDRTIFARKCSVRELDSTETNKFLDENHIQGKCNSSVRLGLTYNGEIISVMTFSKPRFIKNKIDWELVRFCNKLGYHVPGGASRLLKHFEIKYNPQSLVSYADRRWSCGNLYKKLGFSLTGKSKPNYWYIDKSFDTIYNRVNFQKHKLKKLLSIFNENKSEFENMKENGYDRIFDCGNLVFIKTYKKDEE